MMLMNNSSVMSACTTKNQSNTISASSERPKSTVNTMHGAGTAYNPSTTRSASTESSESPTNTLNNASAANNARSPQLMMQATVLITHHQPREQLPQLKNVISSINLGCRLDLKKIALNARNAEYNPKRMPAVMMRIRQPRTTALIFASGKVVVTGAKDEAASRLAARKYARIMQKLGFNVTSLDFKIINLVGCYDVKFPIRLESLHLVCESVCSYEPELYPALIYSMQKPRVVLHIFPSGKVVLAGAKVRKDIHEAFKNIYPMLKKFQVISE